MKQSALRTTRWSKDVTAENVWKEYPRPTMVRSSYYNLNGWWECAFFSAEEAGSWQKILVPFSPESPLSGVDRQLLPGETLWYRRRVKVPAPAPGHRLLLHFGAVDQACEVYLNGQCVGSHRGGYLPFSFDITEYLPSRLEVGFELALRVEDPSDTSYHSRGKQKLENGGMFYTAQSGIWQTVWMEEVPEVHIAGVVITPDFDEARCLVTVQMGEGFSRFVKRCSQDADEDGGSPADSAAANETEDIGRFAHIRTIDEEDLLSAISIRAIVRPESEADRCLRDHPTTSEPAVSSDVPAALPFIDAVGSKETALVSTVLIQVSGSADKPLTIPLPDFHPWTPEDPFLYHLTLETESDRVECYFAMRKCDVQTDKHRKRRLFLNNKPYFQTGVLDQGYWPDGLYTASCDDALIYDIQSMKDLGFNMLRKHIKIEPQRWYYHCDRLGMLVWQDMVNGGSAYQHWYVTYLATLMNTLRLRAKDGSRSRGLLSRRDMAGQLEFYHETKRTIETLYNHPSIVVWVPFNEGWGQFDALKAVEFIRELDSTRLIDHASGWYDQKGGDLASLHYYFFTLWVKPEKVRALVLSEYGGYAWYIPEHSYGPDEYGYRIFENRESLTAGYRELHEKLIFRAVKKGISATVYTQVSDVEDEVNGFLTYDREILKPEAETIRKMNRTLQNWGHNPG